MYNTEQDKKTFQIRVRHAATTKEIPLLGSSSLTHEKCKTQTQANAAIGW